MPVRYLVTRLLDLVSATFVKFVWHRGLGMWIFTESCQIAHFSAKLSNYATTPRQYRKDGLAKKVVVSPFQIKFTVVHLVAYRE
jgi:hypothetical protein